MLSPSHTYTHTHTPEEQVKLISIRGSGVGFVLHQVTMTRHALHTVMDLFILKGLGGHGHGGAVKGTLRLCSFNNVCVSRDTHTIAQEWISSFWKGLDAMGMGGLSKAHCVRSFVHFVCQHEKDKSTHPESMSHNTHEAVYLNTHTPQITWRSTPCAIVLS